MPIDLNGVVLCKWFQVVAWADDTNIRARSKENAKETLSKINDAVKEIVLKVKEKKNRNNDTKQK